jgi:patched 1 protein
LFLQGRATGNHWALWIRAKAHDYLGFLGDLVHRSAGKVIFVGILVLAALCVGLKSAHMVTSLEKLWVQGKVEEFD